VSDIGWVFVAFGVVWAGIGVYVLTLGARQRELERRVDELGSR
jgi:CcmD family protein